MPDADTAVLDFLLTRRSLPAKLMGPPGPERAELTRILTAGLRVPDHGKLTPWRLVVLRGEGLARFAAAIRARAAETGADADKGAVVFERAPVVVAVVASPQPSEKIPRVEQTLSAGSVCLSLLNAALASGWAANWLTGWPAYDADLLRAALGLGEGEWLPGFVHIGTADVAPPDRPRPETEALTTWIEA